MKNRKGFYILGSIAVLIILAVIGFASCSTMTAVASVPGSIPVTVAAAPGTGTAPVIVTPEMPPQEFIPLIEMVSIAGGTFPMGSNQRGPSALEIERPIHRVTVRDFSIGKYEVTQGQYYRVMGSRPSNFMSNPEDLSPDGWMKLPVEMINWYEAIIFCNKLSFMENLNPVYRINNSTDPDDWGDPPETIRHRAWNVEMISGANGYRLPTEAEWEYAARGGGSSKGFNFAGSNNVRTVSWFYDNSEFKSHEVGKKEPNELGLYDMSGNVMEWCWDWLDDYTANPKDNPVGPPSGLYRIIRGGGWSITSFYGRVAYRHNNYPYYRGINLGFRVVQSL